MDDFSVMNVLHSQANLGEQIKNRVFRHVATSLLFYLVRHVTSISKVHDDAKLSLPGFKSFNEFDYIRMLKMFDNLGLLKSLFPLMFAHFGDINDFHNTLELVRVPLDEVCLSEGSFTKQLNLFVVREFFFLLQLVHFEFRSII